MQSGQEEIIEFLFSRTNYYYAHLNTVIDYLEIRDREDHDRYFDTFLSRQSDVVEPSQVAAESSKYDISSMTDLKRALKSLFNRRSRTDERPHSLEPRLPRSSNSSGSFKSLDPAQSSDDLEIPVLALTKSEAGVSFSKPKDLEPMPSESKSTEPQSDYDLAHVLDLDLENDSDAFVDFDDLDDLPLQAAETHRPKKDCTEVENKANRPRDIHLGEDDPDEPDREVLIQPKRHDPAGIKQERMERMERMD